MRQSGLSRREQQIATLVATGRSNKEIARELTISIKTVKNTLTKVFDKTGVLSRTELAIRMIETRYRENIPDASVRRLVYR